MTTRKISVSVEEALVEAMRGRIGARAVSQFVSRAIQHELEVVKAGIAGVSTALNGCSRTALKMGELGVLTVW